MAEMRERLEKFALSLHPEKTRLIEFGRFAAKDRGSRGLGKPETFNFLGFTHICSRSRRGAFQLKRQTRRDRMRARLRAIKEELQRRMHEPIPLQGKWLGQVVRGYLAYHAVPTNSRCPEPSGTMWSISGDARSRSAASGIAPPGTGWRNSRRSSCHRPTSFIPGPACASPSNTQGGSPVRESRPPGSVRGVRRKAHPYRDRTPGAS